MYMDTARAAIVNMQIKRFKNIYPWDTTTRFYPKTAGSLLIQHQGIRSQGDEYAPMRFQLIMS